MSSVAMSGHPSVVSIDDLSESDIRSASSVTSDAEYPSRALTPGGVEGAVKHPEFYYEDGSLTLLVDGTLFRVHGSVFASRSPFWKEKLKSAPCGLVHNIKDASSDELVNFLSVVYPSIYDAPEVNTVPEWTAVLKFATMWQFKAVRRLAMKQLDERVSPFQRLVLARAYNLSPWLEQAFVILILADELPGGEQLESLNSGLMKDLIMIMRAREAIVKGRLSDDVRTVLLHVQERILTVAPTPSVEARPSASETSAIPSSIVHTQPQIPSTPSQLMALARTLQASPIEEADPSLSSIHWQPAPQSLPSNPPTAPLTPALTSMFVYVPYSLAEAHRVKDTMFYYGAFDRALETISSASVPGFCEILNEQNFNLYTNRFFLLITARAARFSDFHLAGLYIVAYAIRSFHPMCDFETDVKATLAVLDGLDEAQLSDDNISTTFDGIPATYMSGSRQVSLPVYDYLGSKEFLVYHPAICRQRVENLKAFLTALIQAVLCCNRRKAKTASAHEDATKDFPHPLWPSMRLPLYTTGAFPSLAPIAFPHLLPRQSQIAIPGSPSVVSIDDLSESDIEFGPLSSATSGAEHLSRAPSPGRGADDAVKHPQFYYEDGSLTLLASGTLYCVHGSVFTSLSPFWADKLQSASSGAIHRVEEVSSSDLASFLSVVYPRIFDTPEVETVAQWTAVLRVASMWNFEAVKRLAVKQLDERVSPLQRLVLARAYDLSGWLERAFVDLILLEELPSWEEMERLNVQLKDFARVTTAREAIVRGRLSASRQPVLLHVQKTVLSAPPVPATEPPSREAAVCTSPAVINGTSNFESLIQPTTPTDGIPREAATSTSINVPTAEFFTPLPTPTLLLSLEAYVPYSAIEKQRVSQALFDNEFDTAFESLPLGSLPALCELIAFNVTVHHRIGAYALMTALLSRAARAPDFHEAGVHIGQFARTPRILGASFNQEASRLVKALLWLFLTLDQSSHVDINRTLENFSSQRDEYIIKDIVGEWAVLTFYPVVFWERIANLRVFVAMLIEDDFVTVD
ncbi:hypothetical protein PENSPDRAFT_660846 [Peniophora sp. CONT]|nr:hypothetical protein PENSPDRAFT_660846 [Peniophora sp. CONT]